MWWLHTMIITSLTEHWFTVGISLVSAAALAATAILVRRSRQDGPR